MRRSPSGSPSLSSSCGMADQANLEPLADMLGEIEEALVAVDKLEFERALEVVAPRAPRIWSPTRSTPPVDGATLSGWTSRRRRLASAGSGAQRRRSAARRPERGAPSSSSTIPIEPRRRADAAVRSEAAPRRSTARARARPEDRRGPGARSPRAWSPTTTSRRPAEGPPVPPCPDGREGGRDARGGRTPRTSTRCASRPVVSERRGGSSARRSRQAHGGHRGAARLVARLARSATSTS